MLACSVIVSLCAVAAPVPRVPELAPPPREKTPRPWDRTDLRAPGPDDRFRDQKRFAEAFFDYVSARQFKLETPLKLCAPRTVTLAELGAVRDCGLPRSKLVAVLVSEDAKEWVFVTGEAQLQIGEKTAAGHVAVTLTRTEKGEFRVKGAHLGEAAALKRLLTLYSDAYPNQLP